MEIQKKLITPAKAVELLQANVKNRNPKKPVVLKYANDMANGKWKQDTFELIKISKTGVILDGQHRLLAVIKANIPIYFHVVEGLEDSIFDVLDTGSIRNAADVFKINGVANDCLIPAIIGFYNNLKKGNGGRDGQANQKLTNAAALIKYNENPEHWQMIARKSLSSYGAFGKILVPSFIGGMLAFLHDIDGDYSIDFIDQLCTGRDLKNESINILRAKLLNDKVSIQKISTVVKSAYVIKTWNACRENKSVKILRFVPNVDNFPIAI